MKPMSGQILRIFKSIGRVYPLKLAKNLRFYPWLNLLRINQSIEPLMNSLS